MEEKEFRDWLSTYTNDEAFFFALKNQKNTFRVNTIKISNEVFDEITNIECEKYGWYKDARRCASRLQLGNTFEYFLGYLHPQSLSSMIPPIVLEPQENEYVLDMCASPGSKTTQIAAIMKNTGTLVANDLPEREIAIIPNIARLGVLNVIITNRDAKNYPLKSEFNRVLLDAPCTALGSNLNAIRRFSKEIAEKMARIQKMMILRAFDALRPDGILVYSTCTITPEECEGVIQFLLEKREDARVEKINLEIEHSNGLSEYGKELEKTWRIYPQQIGSEGFYIAKIKKV
ncbi:MAG: RsmB/NOP family class I SAM-dependent RNA methyltransferase [Candidatus Bilamarchaeaceae archaeon]